ncbi:hypothetical protein Y032_0307g2020 [Ancylostoma ceylanicum]|uniref:Secreted protein n=1 Tax=Ancylostoma ceylanicum TaxID=53326 RepID=A0A016S2P6_9BILA|nr:hypothetical protein Y032_0307g2020 [Ancylostoma ceylanicum]
MLIYLRITSCYLLLRPLTSAVHADFFTLVVSSSQHELVMSRYDVDHERRCEDHKEFNSEPEMIARNRQKTPESADRRCSWLRSAGFGWRNRAGRDCFGVGPLTSTPSSRLALLASRRVCALGDARAVSAQPARPTSL